MSQIGCMARPPLPQGGAAKLGGDAINALVKRVRAPIHSHKARTRNHYALSTYPSGRGNHAFTLVELSIVLVILGLLVGGVLAGQNLIRAAELRSVVTTAEQMKAAIYTFEGKYFQIPGDMTNASAFWGADCGAGADTGRCDGNGDGQIYALEMRGGLVHMTNAGLLSSSTDMQESSGSYVNAWTVEDQMLPITSSMGIIQGSTPGITTTKSSSNSDLKINLRVLLVSGAPTSSNAVLGMVYHNANSPAMSPEEAWNIDKKIDDGHGRGGNVIGKTGGANTCTGATNAFPAPDYQLGTTDKTCMLYIGY